MNRLINWSANLFYTQKSTDFIWAALFIALIPATGVIGNLPFTSLENYALYVCVSAYCIIKAKRISVPFCLMFFAGFISIVAGNPLSLFRSWERFVLWAILLFAFTPIVNSSLVGKLRYRVLNYTLLICCFVGISSLVCYALGINYMTLTYLSITSADIGNFGRFSGLTRHSMVLGPISAISLVCFFWLLLFKSGRKSNKMWVATGLILSLCSMFLSASRGASLAGIFGCVMMLFARYHNHLPKLVNSLLAMLVAAIALFPIYQPYLEKTLQKQEMNMHGGSTFMSRDALWQHRIQEFCENPFFGVGFAAVDTNIEHKYNRINGIVEPGSSWLAVASMTGIMGLMAVLATFIVVYFRTFKRSAKSPTATLLIGLLSIFSVHLITEGYIFAGGNYLCLLFWLVFGVAYSFTADKRRYYYEYKKTLHFQPADKISAPQPLL